MRKSPLNTANARPPSQRSETVHWDTEVPKLGLRQRGTTSSWIVQWRADGRTRKQTLGRADAIPLSQARELARALLDGVTAGAAPYAAPTVAAFSRRYLKDLAPSWKPATHRANSHDVEHLIIPCLGSKRLNQVTRADLVSWKDGLPGSAASGNRALAVLSGMMRHAELLGLQPPGSNPCKGLRRRKTSFKATYLSEAQWASLGLLPPPRHAGELLRWTGGVCAVPALRSGAPTHAVACGFLRLTAPAVSNLPTRTLGSEITSVAPSGSEHLLPAPQRSEQHQLQYAVLARQSGALHRP
nr:integrase arm-type DNA-binding domain-containing protein [Phaeobacter italicus]